MNNFESTNITHKEKDLRSPQMHVQNGIQATPRCEKSHKGSPMCEKKLTLFRRVKRETRNSQVWKGVRAALRCEKGTEEKKAGDRWLRLSAVAVVAVWSSCGYCWVMERPVLGCGWGLYSGPHRSPHISLYNSVASSRNTNSTWFCQDSWYPGTNWPTPHFFLYIHCLPWGAFVNVDHSHPGSFLRFICAVGTIF